MNNIQKRLLEYATQIYKLSKVVSKDFHNKIRIALKEMRESRYWLHYFKKVSPKNAQLESLLDESEELCKILSAIAFKTKTP